MRIGPLAAAAMVALALAGCDSFDPLDKFQDWDIMGGSKTPLKGERREVFPQGVPGVPQGVPPEMVKGYQPPAEEPPPVVEAKPDKKARKKAAPPPRKQARTRPKQEPQEPQEEAEPAEPPMRQAPAARTTTQPVQQQPGGYQSIPGSQPTWPSNAQPAPTR
jgi:hypothetical protein